MRGRAGRGNSLDKGAYAANALVRSAVERPLEILGEACRRAVDDSPDLQDRLPDVALAIGLRNRIIHGQDKLDRAIILETVQRDLPGLIERLRIELQQFPTD